MRAEVTQMTRLRDLAYVPKYPTNKILKIFVIWLVFTIVTYVNMYSKSNLIYFVALKSESTPIVTFCKNK